MLEATAFWHARPVGSALKPHLRSAVVRSFEFSHEPQALASRAPAFAEDATALLKALAADLGDRGGGGRQVETEQVALPNPRC